MSTITTRANKGNPLTHDEVDANFNNINNDLIVAEAEIDALQGSLITGPASSTDNALARFDTATGNLLQNSVVVVDDSGNVSGVGTVDGRTLATDGAKLDGIEAGATADQTDAEIETAYNLQVSQVSAGEKTAGTETAVRRLSPADVKGMIDTHSGSGYSPFTAALFSGF